MLLLATETVLGFRETLRQQLDEKNQGMFAITVSARPGRLSAPRVLVNRFCMGFFVWTSGAINSSKPWFPAGQVPDNATSNTAAFERAVAAVRKAGGGTLYVPDGAFRTGPFSRGQ